jgi:hypothetical protein
MQKKKLTVRPSREDLYTFMVNCSFTLQYTFERPEVRPGGKAIGKRKGKSTTTSSRPQLRPTKKALNALARDLTEVLRYHYSVGPVECFAGVKDLLGVNDVYVNHPSVRV